MCRLLLFLKFGSKVEKCVGGQSDGNSKLLFTFSSNNQRLLVRRKVFTLNSKLSEFFSEAYC